MQQGNLLILIVITALLLLGGWWYFIRDNDGSTGMQRNVDMLADGGIHEVVTSDEQYFGSAVGYYARPDEEGSHPGVVMIHEWWGLNDNIRDMARQLASEGYAVLAVDLYNGEVADTSDRARELRTSLDQEMANQNLRAAVSFLREENAPRIASLGWCFGGGQSLALALSGEMLDATVIYYGSLSSDTGELSRINWPVLGIFGEEDSSIPVAEVEEFDMALDTVGVQHAVYVYPGVGHAFANPSGDNYAPEETMDAWQKTLAFLEETLK